MGGVMATETARSPARGQTPKLKSGKSTIRTCAGRSRPVLDDFNAMRGDLLFAGVLYVLIGFVAAVMTTSGQLLPSCSRSSPGSVCSGRRRRRFL